MAPASKTWIVLVAFFLGNCCSRVLAGGKIQFNRDIQPILAKHCLACHGLDEESREAGLRLDLQEISVSRN